MLKHVKSLSGHQNPVYALANSGKEGIFFTGGNDKGVVEWSLEKMSFLKVLMPVKSSVYSLHYYGDQLFAGQRSGEVTVFDFTTQTVKTTFQAHEKPVFDIVVIPSKEEFLTASEDGTVGVWSLIDNLLLYRIPVSYDTVRAIAISPDGEHAAFGCKDGMIRIYNLTDYSLEHTLEQHTLPVTSVQYSPDGKYLISGGRDAQLNFWSLPTYEFKHNIPAHLFSVYGIAFNPVLPYFATASQDKSIKLWGADDLRLYKILSIEKNTHGHTHSINKLVWTPDGKYLITTGDDKLVMIWSWE
ncbi:WD40 repeat domain-containing protein [Pedobacter sp. MC2016-15]|uniref:WD40 repeat domain-containing protein n=1 Tax=Pedobacter sp. MC2016-15 TaxID=2994473 RepID=UPI0022451E5E|nr:WD40 repeat domain-containing protein [Pedobacter sp. MC2016-15]MCX2479309.1 WD40 repeat domain-containing protein [Pedobacter sp. MC2016-15]